MSAQKEYKEPESDLNISKTIKKTAVNWLVTALLIMLVAGVLALGRAQVLTMLVDYQTKTQALEDKAIAEKKVESLREQVQTLQDSVNQLDRKLDHLQYTVDYNQNRDGRAQSPKQKDANP